MKYISHGFNLPLDLRAYAPGEWIVLTEIIYTSLDGNRYTVPKGFITDLASIPKMAQGIFSVDDESRMPAVLHDWLYCSKQTTREQADALFREALKRAGCSTLHTLSMWSAVRVAGWAYWNKRSGITAEDFVQL